MKGCLWTCWVLREQGLGADQKPQKQKGLREAQRKRYLLRFPSSLEGHYYQDPLWDQGLCSGSHVGSQGTYLCVTADRAAVWLQDRMNVVCSRCFPKLEGGAPTGFRPCVPTPICAMRVNPDAPVGRGWGRGVQAEGKGMSLSADLSLGRDSGIP